VRKRRLPGGARERIAGALEGLAFLLECGAVALDLEWGRPDLARWARSGASVLRAAARLTGSRR